MKTKILLFAFIAMMPFCAYAQQSETLQRFQINQTEEAERAKYLKMAMDSLEKGNHRSAQINYTIYRDLDGKPLPSFEALINGTNSSDTTKTYTVGDVIRIGNDLYTVANVTNRGKHGFAICEMGSGTLKPEYITQRKIPTWSEFEIIKANNTVLKLSGLFWSSEPTTGGTNYYKVCGLGGFTNTYDPSTIQHSLIFVHRF